MSALAERAAADSKQADNVAQSTPHERSSMPAHDAHSGGASSRSTKVVVPPIGSAVESDDMNCMSEIAGSLCMHCGGEGTTRMLMTKIPFFREVIISSFDCENCFWSNNEVLFGGELQERGRKIELTVRSEEDLDRQIIKSDYASVSVPVINFEIPPKTQQGEITTVEGLLSTAAERLGYEQEYRMEHDPIVGRAVADIIDKLTAMAAGEAKFLPFKITVDDPSGNSFVENPHAPARDPGLTVHDYTRSAAQDMLVGLQPSEASVAAGTIVEPGSHSDSRTDNTDNNTNDDNNSSSNSTTKLGPAAAIATVLESGLAPVDADSDPKDNFMRREHARFEDVCPSCRHAGETLMCMVDIPHFKEVIIMAFDCPECGYKSNEVKGGGSIPAQGTRHTLTAQSEADFSRDILKSDTCAVVVPELDLELDMGTLGSVYSTLEGLLEKIRTSLADGNPFYSGDSTTGNHSTTEGGMQRKFRVFLEKLDLLRSGGMFPFTLVLRDPLANSFIGSPSYDDPAKDPQIKTEKFDRSHDDNDMMGLNDIKTEGYEQVPEGQSGDKPFQQHIEPVQKRAGTDHPTYFTKGMEAQDVTQSSYDFEHRPAHMVQAHERQSQSTTADQQKGADTKTTQ